MFYPRDLFSVDDKPSRLSETRILISFRSSLSSSTWQFCHKELGIIMKVTFFAISAVCD